jgi:hypothetical protein
MTRLLLPQNTWLILLPKALNPVTIYLLQHSLLLTLLPWTAYFCLPLALMKLAGLSVTHSVDFDGIPCCWEEGCSPTFTSLLNYILNNSWPSYTFPFLQKQDLFCSSRAASLHKIEASNQNASERHCKFSNFYNIIHTEGTETFTVIFKMCCTIHVLFPTKYLQLHNFMFFNSNNIHVFQKASSTIEIHSVAKKALIEFKDWHLNLGSVILLCLCNQCQFTDFLGGGGGH